MERNWKTKENTYLGGKSEGKWQEHKTKEKPMMTEEKNYVDQSAWPRMILYQTNKRMNASPSISMSLNECNHFR